MIALPEIETIRRDVDRECTGKKIKDVQVQIARAVGGAKGKTRMGKALEGAKISGVSRVGRLLQLDFDNGFSLMFDLGTGGQVRRNANKDQVHKRTAMVLAFTQHGQLRLVDMNADASVALHETESLLEDQPDPDELGLDPIEQAIAWPDFGRLLHRHQTKLKTLLTDDSFVVGLGHMYADEILFNAGLRFDRLSNSLTTQEVRRLCRALVETLHDAVKYRGSTVEGSPYLDVFGEPGSYQDHHAVFQKDGQLSPRNRKPISKTKFSGQWTYYCAESQV